MKIADDTLSSITGKKSIKIFDSITFELVLHVLKILCNLLYVSKLIAHTNCSAKFISSCIFQDLSSWKTIGSARENEGLYYFEMVNVSK